MRYIVFALFLMLPVSSHAAMDGIQSLNSVTQMRSDNANEDAQLGASRSRDNVRQQKELRRQNSQFDTGNKKTNPNSALNDAKLQDLERKIAEIEQKLNGMGGLDERQMLRLQRLMDRMQRTQRMASNLLKKQSDTAHGITQNLK